MNKWQAVTFVTTGTGYEREVERLALSAARLSIPLRIYHHPNLRNWRLNLNWKSLTILEAMTDYPDKDIVWVDADAKFHSWPALFDELSLARAHDIAFHRWVHSRLDPGRELLSGTLWVANTERGAKLVSAWHEKALKSRAIRHQRALDEVLKGERAGWRCFALPVQYTAIFDHRAVRGRIQPVIEHFQASRRLRRAVGVA